MNFSARLKELRESRGLSQEELATALEIPRSSITNYESEENVRLPRHERLKKMAEFFSVSVDYLLGGAKDDAYYEYAPTDEIRDVLEKYEDIDNIIKQFYIYRFNRDYGSIARFIEVKEHTSTAFDEKFDPQKYSGVNNVIDLFKTYDFDFKLQYLHAMVADARIKRISFEDYLLQNEVTFTKRNRSVKELMEDLVNSLDISHKNATKIKNFENSENGRVVDIDDVIKIPIYGEIKAGYDFVGEQNITGYEFTSKKSVSDGEYFYLIVRGDSMIDDGIFEGCRVLVRKQNTVENGKIGVCIVNDDETTMKRVFYDGDQIILVAANKKIPPKTYDISEVLIQGQVKSYVVDL